MLEMGTSGLMSGAGKRDGASASALAPSLDSTKWGPLHGGTLLRGSCPSGSTFVAFDLLVRGHVNQLGSLQPPRRSRIKVYLRLSAELVPIASQVVTPDSTTSHRPETPATSFVTEVI